MALTPAEKQHNYRERQRIKLAQEMDTLRKQVQAAPAPEPTGVLASLLTAPRKVFVDLYDDDEGLVVTLVAESTFIGATFKSPADALEEARRGYVTINGETVSVAVRNALRFVGMVFADSPEGDEAGHEAMYGQDAIRELEELGAQEKALRSEAAKRGAATRKARKERKLAGG